MPPHPTRTQFSWEASQCQGQSWARWQRGDPSASIALEVARVRLASLLRMSGLLLATSCGTSGGGGEPETGLQERGQGGRDGSEDTEVGQGCAITVLPEGEQSANRRLSLLSSCHRLLLLSISSHTSTLTQKKFRPFFLFFFFKVQKALCCPRERIFGQAVQCKVKGGS